MNRDSKTRYEHPDPTPIEVPFGFLYESLADTIGRMVAVEHGKLLAKKQHIESFKESQDFDEDADEFTSPHEMTDIQEEMPSTWLDEVPEKDPHADITPSEVPPPTPVATEPPEAPA